METSSRRLFIITSAAAAAAVALSACGSDDTVASSATDASTTSNPDSTSTGVESTAAADTGTVVEDVTACDGTATPEHFEGPFYLDGAEARVDITEGLNGTPFAINVMVYDTDCNPLEGAVVDIWHASEEGNYSGFDTWGTAGETWLRGVQSTDSTGAARFNSNIPAPYPMRTTHLHMKVRADGHDELTTQLFIDQDIIDALFTGFDTTNSTDNGWREELEMELVESGDGYETTLAIVLG